MSSYKELENLSPEERAVAMKILEELSTGDDSSYTDLLYGDHKEIPVDIETFLHDKMYLGNGLIDNEGRFTVYPYWVSVLKKVFPTNLDIGYNTLILSGAIGIGKSFVAVICMLYLLYRMLCLKDPYQHYGLQPIDTITFSMLNLTMDAAKGVGWAKMQELLKISPWFQQHGWIDEKRDAEWHPNGNLELIYGSQTKHIIGRAVFCLDGDTLILTDKGTKSLKECVDENIRVVSMTSEGTTHLSDICTVKPTVQTTEEYQITLEDDTVIKCTSNHLFLLTTGEYKEACMLTEEDEIADFNYVGYVYKVTNVDTKEFYIGQHKKQYLNEDYYGSGDRITRSVRKHGKENFKQEILYWASTYEELTQKEYEYIQPNKNNPLCLNLDFDQFVTTNNGSHDTLSSRTSIINDAGDVQYIEKGSPIPEGWRKGNTALGKTCITNDKENRFVASVDNIPVGWWIGSKSKGTSKSVATRKRMSESVKLRDPKSFTGRTSGMMCITNGEINKYVSPEADVPEGFRKGMTTKGKGSVAHQKSWTPERRKQQSKKNSGKGNPNYGKGLPGELNGRYGKPMGEESKQKARKALSKYIFTYDGKEFIGEPLFVEYIRNNGYPTFSGSSVQSVLQKTNKKYPELFDKIEKRCVQ